MMEWFADLALVLIALVLSYPWVPATAGCLALLFIITAAMRWLEDGVLDSVEPTEHGPFQS